MLAFVAAEAREFSGVLRHAEEAVRLDWPLDFARSARLNGKPILLVANGPGPQLAGRAVEVAVEEVAKEHRELEGFVSTGYCGALDPALRAGAIFVASEVLVPGRASLPTHSLGDRPNSVRGGKLLSIDRVVTTAAEKGELRRTTGADAVEMEAAAVGAEARKLNIPFYAIRVVTDTAADGFALDFNRMRDRSGRFSRARILGAALGSPFVFPQLLRLNKTSKVAAEALGNFIADTRF